jgi:hypothetical protein
MTIASSAVARHVPVVIIGSGPSGPDFYWQNGWVDRDGSRSDRWNIWWPGGIETSDRCWFSYGNCNPRWSADDHYRRIKLSRYVCLFVFLCFSPIHVYEGFPDDITGPELIERMFAQAKRFGCNIIEEFATDVKLKQGGPQKVAFATLC